MTTQRTAPVAASLKQLLVPMLALAGPDAQTPMGMTVGEGLSLPDPDTLRSKGLPRDSVIPMFVDTRDWLEKVVRPQWLAPNLYEQLHPVAKGVNGQDAFVGAWEVHGQVVQVAVTRQRLHLLTRSRQSPEERDPQEPYQAAIQRAQKLLRLGTGIDPAVWQFREFAGLQLAYQDHAAIRDWTQTLTVLTDGTAFKFSIRKLDNAGTPQVESLLPDLTPAPWFEGK